MGRDGWKETKLGEVFKMTSGGTPSRRNSEYYGGTIPWVKSGELGQTKIRHTEEYITEAGLKGSSAKLFPKGTVLIALYGATIGKVSVLDIEASTNQAIAGIFENDLVEREYLVNYLNYKKSYLVSLGIGGAQPNISQGILKELEFPLPPLPEQRAIVAKLEVLLGDLDRSVGELEVALGKLGVYRQSVLKEGFSGRLTEGNSKQVEIATLGSFIENPKYGTSQKCTKDVRGKAVLRIPNLKEGFIDTEELKYAEFDEIEIEKYTLQAGDLLTIRSNGSVDLVGKTAIVRPVDTDFLFAGYLIRLRPLPTLDSKYLHYCLSSFDLRLQIESKAKSTSGVNNINSKELQALKIPVFTLPEQHQIVSEIESRLSVADALEREIVGALERVKGVRMGVLKRAFSGELV